ncbi:MAG: hypothetical protein A3F70_06390 [Acidobacteria bacterium RIFCSPLOWO2_12_FULL_67_14]|nr:MAG: hypothetical protein A3H29_01965 [Acidobacteria bacterium RIFCSPLOWO2_02_FULL_67_21]OFW37015.1 MAG: hypothetical protein A3F70_06390 [Acidobacteria bacterium RIFCSPLOWO2_12_FULL_67_14]
MLGGASLLVFVFMQPSPPEDSTATVAARPAPARPRRAAPAPAATPSEPAARAPEPEAPPPSAEEAPREAAAAPPSAGVLRVQTDVPGAQVFIDRQFIGTAPITADGVASGTHQLNVSAEGFESVAMPVEVTAGEREIMIRFREVRLDSIIDVVHRHGMGSCRGKLIATAQGLRYETANRDDAFTTPLLDLETFQVDYLEKNLRVKLRKGRQFNFTDPEGNADRLFVFHRDVEKARDRLKRGDRPATE